MCNQNVNLWVRTGSSLELKRMSSYTQQQVLYAACSPIALAPLRRSQTMTSSLQINFERGGILAWQSRRKSHELPCTRPSPHLPRTNCSPKNKHAQAMVTTAHSSWSLIAACTRSPLILFWLLVSGLARHDWVKIYKAVHGGVLVYGTSTLFQANANLLNWCTTRRLSNYLHFKEEQVNIMVDWTICNQWRLTRIFARLLQVQSYANHKEFYIRGHPPAHWAVSPLR
jgi:hypothetical protein